LLEEVQERECGEGCPLVVQGCLEEIQVSQERECGEGLQLVVQGYLELVQVLELEC
jgi:hypothetical protein